MSTLSINELSKSERARLGLGDHIGGPGSKSGSAPVRLAGFGSQAPPRDQNQPRPWWWHQPKPR